MSSFVPSLCLVAAIISVAAGRPMGAVLLLLLAVAATLIEAGGDA